MGRRDGISECCAYMSHGYTEKRGLFLAVYAWRSLLFYILYANLIISIFQILPYRIKSPASRTLAPERGRFSGHTSLARSVHPASLARSAHPARRAFYVIGALSYYIKKILIPTAGFLTGHRKKDLYSFSFTQKDR